MSWKKLTATYANSYQLKAMLCVLPGGMGGGESSLDLFGPSILSLPYYQTHYFIIIKTYQRESLREWQRVDFQNCFIFRVDHNLALEQKKKLHI